MRKKIVSTLCLCFGAAVVMLFPEPANAVKQKYTRHYQKKEPRFQKKTPYYQKKDLPNAGAYFEVSRKTPRVSVEYQPQETVYKSDRPDIVCRDKSTFSCTRFAVGFSVSANCDDSKIVLTVSETEKMTVELSSLYEKGSCRFDLMLKHESSHVEAYRKTLSDFIKQTEQKLAAIYASGQRETKGCKDVQKRIKDFTEGLADQYAQTAAEKNDLLDREKGTHAYGFEKCDLPDRQERKNE